MEVTLQERLPTGRRVLEKPSSEKDSLEDEDRRMVFEEIPPLLQPIAQSRVRHPPFPGTAQGKGDN